jgi:vacuolar protein sorting-associated protein 13A/C
VSLAAFLVTLEAGTDIETAPLIRFETGLEALITDWTGLLTVNAGVTTQLDYYNETFSVWEPIIEPVEAANGVFENWRAKLEVS